MFSLLFSLLERKRAHFEEALARGDLQEEIPIAGEARLFICGEGILTHTTDRRRDISPLGGGRG